MSENTIIYHRDCVDGFCAAWVTYRALKDKDKQATAEFFACNYQESFSIPDEAINGKNIYIVDFSFANRLVMQNLASRAKSFHCFDHHDGTEDKIKGLPGCIFDKDRCGSMIAWGYFFPDVAAPDLVEYVQDYDLWQFKLPDSKAVNAAIQSYPFVLTVYDELYQRMYHNHITLRSEGEAILRQKIKEIEQAKSMAIQMTIDGHIVKGVNSSANVSELANALIDDNGFGVAFFMKADRSFSVSMRAKGKVNVTEIAKKFGGGGHPSGNAAGFRVKDIQQFLST